MLATGKNTTRRRRQEQRFDVFTDQPLFSQPSGRVNVRRTSPAIVAVDGGFEVSAVSSDETLLSARSISVVSADVGSSEAPAVPAAIGIVAMTAMATLKTVRRVRPDVATVGFASVVHAGSPCLSDETI